MQDREPDLDGYAKIRMWRLSSGLKDAASIEAICRSLAKFGLGKTESIVYLYLARSGVHKAREVSKDLSIQRTETYKILRKLEEKGLIYRILDKPTKFAALKIDTSLENLMRANKRKIAQLEEEKHAVVRKWSSLSGPVEYTDAPDYFIQVLKGRHQIYSRVEQIIENARSEILMIVSDERLVQMFNSRTLDDLASKSRKINVHLTTGSSLRNSYVIKNLQLFGRDISYANSAEIPSFIISDNNLLVFLDKEIVSGKEGPRALWTNQTEMVRILRTSFYSLSGREHLALAALEGELEN